MSAISMRKQAEGLLKLARIEERILEDTGLDGAVKLNKDHHSGVNYYTYVADFFGTAMAVGIGNEMNGVEEYPSILEKVKAQLRSPTENDIRVLEKMGYTVTKA